MSKSNSNNNIKKIRSVHVENIYKSSSIYALHIMAEFLGGGSQLQYFECWPLGACSNKWGFFALKFPAERYISDSMYSRAVKKKFF